MIDLRSDTVTKPGGAMRQAMAEAEVGDDVYGEDPTVNRLQEEVAALFGKEAGLFVPSGTMANQLSLKSHTQPGDEVIIHPSAHIVRAEGGAAAALAGVQFRMIGGREGAMSAEEVGGAIVTEDNPHFPRTRLLCMENTHNFAGGRVLPLESIEAVAMVARSKGVALHLDGARVLNAAVALDVKPERIAAHFDSLTLCFSKGLGAPVGSLIMGRGKFIHRCHRNRKMYGGGMRQAGILAAAALFAINHNVAALAEDHANATRLAQGLDAHPGLSLPFGLPESNIVYFSSSHPEVSTGKLVAELKERGVLMGGVYAGAARAVTHLDVTSREIEQALQAVGEILAG